MKRRPSSGTPRARHLFQFIGLFLLLIVIGSIGVAFLFLRPSSSQKKVKNILIVPSTIDGFSGQIILAQHDPQAEQLKLIFFNADIPLSLIGGYGQYPLRSVYPLLHLDKRSDSYMLAAYSVGLNMVVDEVWTSANPQLFAGSDTKKILQQELLNFQINAPMSVKDRLTMYQSLSQLRADKIEKSEVNSLAEWEKQSEQFKFPNFTAECSIAVINMTGQRSLGPQVSKVLEKSGLLVIRVSDTADPSLVHVQSSVLTNSTDPRCQETADHLQKVVPIPVQIQYDKDTLKKYRANLVVILGPEVGELLQSPSTK
jgi:hypothetical protein